MILAALAVMVGSVVAWYMGLSEAIGDVASKVLRCPKCLTMWGCMAILIAVYGADVITAAGVSIAMSYVSVWFCLILSWLERKYNKMRMRLSSKRKSR